MEDAALPGDDELEFETTRGVKPIISFEAMGLKQGLLKGVYQFGFEKPSAIQQRAIKPIADGEPMTSHFGLAASNFHKDCGLNLDLSVNCREGRYCTGTVRNGKDVLDRNLSDSAPGPQHTQVRLSFSRPAMLGGAMDWI